MTETVNPIILRGFASASGLICTQGFGSLTVAQVKSVTLFISRLANEQFTFEQYMKFINQKFPDAP